MPDWTLVPPNDFGIHASRWDALNAASGGVPFLQAAFLQPALAILGSGAERVAILGPRDEPLAMAILAPGGVGQWTSFQPSQLPLGAFVARPGVDLDAALGSLFDVLPATAVVVALTQQDPDIRARPGDSGTLDTLDYIQTARVTITGSFEAYWAARGKNLRHNVKRQRAKLDDAGTPGTLEVLTDAHDVATAIAQYGHMESAGWKSAEGTAVHPDNVQGRFYRAMLEAFCQAGAGRIFRYRVGEHVAAIDLGIENAGTLVILKTTYDEAMNAVSPATLMRHAYFAPLFDGGTTRRVEFYGRLMEWHTRWTNEVRTLYHVNRYRSSWLKRARNVMNAVRAG